MSNARLQALLLMLLTLASCQGEDENIVPSTPTMVIYMDTGRHEGAGAGDT